MSFGGTIRYLYSLRKQGIKFGLDNITRILSELNNPHKSFLSVHVAGTNGKGSTAAIIASILQAAGFRVGLFTSPHLVSFTERIRVDGAEITEGEVVQDASEIKEIVSRDADFSPTFFEVVTAMALLYFQRKGIDLAVMEVGMGGRLDATNIILPEVSVISSIGYDHRDFLGDTLGEIAYEKAGIIKETIPVVASHQAPEVRALLSERTRELHSELHMYGEDFTSIIKRQDVSGICFDYRDDSSALEDLILPLTGEHQMQNASVAIRAARIVLSNRSVNPDLPPDHPLANGGLSGRDHSLLKTDQFIREGLKNVRWQGRLELIREDPPIMIDGAHNPSAAVVLSRTLKDIFLPKYGKIIMVLGIMDDKDVSGVMEPLLPLASEIILTSPSYRRSASPERLAGIAADLGFGDVRIAPSLKDAIEMAIGITLSAKVQNSPAAGQPGSSPFEPDPYLILITGSFYTIGEAKEVLGQSGVLTRLRE